MGCESVLECVTTPCSWNHIPGKVLHRCGHHADSTECPRAALLTQPGSSAETQLEQHFLQRPFAPPPDMLAESCPAFWSFISVSTLCCHNEESFTQQVPYLWRTNESLVTKLQSPVSTTLNLQGGSV
ncbi:hypothetical protein FQA47_016874 [Oryzias melastigma]|uniref:Uncharacterized protein n=1 Tax=Oryzias melastigma TaxID=30732 RepID=A0A834BXB4_ORYME|nr:hypothetical protein FQA47_016874 [Oryzias melastigma]